MVRPRSGAARRRGIGLSWSAVLPCSGKYRPEPAPGCIRSARGHVLARRDADQRGMERDAGAKVHAAHDCGWYRHPPDLDAHDSSHIEVPLEAGEAESRLADVDQ